MHLRLALLFLPLLVSSLPALATQRLIACALGEADKKQVAITSEAPLAGSAIYRLVIGGHADYLYDAREEPDDDPAEYSRGSFVEAQCAGDNEQALVVTGEFHSNFLQSVVLRYNQTWGTWERLNLAERSAPEWLYLGTGGFYVVVPNPGRNEAPERYLVYRFDSSKGSEYQAYLSEGPQGSDTLPVLPDYHAIRLKPRRPQP